MHDVLAEFNDRLRYLALSGGAAVLTEPLAQRVSLLHDCEQVREVHGRYRVSHDVGARLLRQAQLDLVPATWREKIQSLSLLDEMSAYTLSQFEFQGSDQQIEVGSARLLVQVGRRHRADNVVAVDDEEELDPDQASHQGGERGIPDTTVLAVIVRT